MSTLASSAPAAPLPVPARPRDFPTWLPAMLVKELRQGLHARGFVGAFVGFQVIMAMIAVFAVAGGAGSNAFGLLQMGYWVMMAAQLLIVTPIRGLMGLQSELDARSVDLLLLTRLTAWRIVAGKWVSLLAQALLLTIALLPYGVVRYFFGSIDLATELYTLVTMFAGCALLTGAALWTSALPKVARVGFGLALFFILQASPLSIERLFRGLTNPGYRGMGSAGLGGPSASEIVPVFFSGAVVLLMCLLGAVRRLAPPADNPSALLRALPLLALLPAPFLGIGKVEAQCAFAGVLAIFIAWLELSRAEEPMPMHWHAWQRFGLFGRIVRRFVQPGWASAFEWLLIVAALAAVCGLATSAPKQIARAVLFAVEALAFPALLLSLVASRHPQRTAVYGLVLGAGSLISGVAVAASSALQAGKLTDALLHVLPISSFWMNMNPRQTLPTGVQATQIGIAVVVLVALWWRAAPYRVQRRLLTARERLAAVSA